MGLLQVPLDPISKADSRYSLMEGSNDACIRNLIVLVTLVMARGENSNVDQSIMDQSALVRFLFIVVF